MGRFTAWDRKSAKLAAALAGVAILVALLVIATTDDGASWARRAAMLGAVAPVAGSIGTLGAVGLARGRGEIVALLALGVSPTRAQLGAVIGGIVIALPGPFVTSSRWADPSALFPTPVESRVWAPGEASAAAGSRGESLREMTMGIQVEPGGRVAFVKEAPQSGAAPRLFPAALVFAALTLCALACPLWVAARASKTRKAVVGLAAVLFLIAAFQAVAMERGSPLLLLVAPLLLLIDVALTTYAGARRVRSRASPA